MPAWSADLRRELVAAYRRGTMDAERCLRTYQAQGERSVLPPEAVAYLAAQAAADRGLGGSDLADWLVDGDEAMGAAIEAGRRFFFPGRRPVG